MVERGGRSCGDEHRGSHLVRHHGRERNATRDQNESGYALPCSFHRFGRAGGAPHAVALSREVHRRIPRVEPRAVGPYEFDGRGDVAEHAVEVVGVFGQARTAESCTDWVDEDEVSRIQPRGLIVLERDQSGVVTAFAVASEPARSERAEVQEQRI